MKQLIQIKARNLKVGDLIFDFNRRTLQKIQYITHEDKIGNSWRYSSEQVINVHIDYGEEAMSADNFEPDDDLLILINLDELKILKPEEII